MVGEDRRKKQINVILYEDQIAPLDDIAKKFGTNRSQFLRMLLDKFIETERIKQGG